MQSADNNLVVFNSMDKKKPSAETPPLVEAMRNYVRPVRYETQQLFRASSNYAVSIFQLINDQVAVGASGLCASIKRSDVASYQFSNLGTIRDVYFALAIEHHPILETD